MINSALPNHLVELGFIQDAQGLRGQIKVRPFSSDPIALLSSKSIWLTLYSPQQNIPSQPIAEPRLYAVSSAKMHSGLVVMTLEGVSDRDQALALKGARLSLGRDAFPKTDSDSYYWVDLMGCQVLGLENTLLGEVSEMTENGAHAIMTVSGDGHVHLIPFVPEIVKAVDLAQKRITVDWQSDW